MLSILYPYRDRDLKRVRRSLDSLLKQKNKNFKVYFIDYGSSQDIAEAIRKLCLNYPFITYKYYPTQFQPWNKSRALNSIIKKLETEFCFIADVDIIFHPDFIDTALDLMKNNITTYFQVAYLDPSQSLAEIQFSPNKNYRLSNDEATGLSLFPVEQLKGLNGFDEFYHFWGAEDTDMHVRLKNAGFKVEFYSDKILLFHQWHESYQRRERVGLTSEFQVNGIISLNHEHLKNAKNNGVTVVNHCNWGEILTIKEAAQLEEALIYLKVTNEKRQVNEVIYGLLPGFKDRIIKIKFTLDTFENSLRYKTKKLMGKKIPEFYSLKEINDLVLLHLISIYRNNPYMIKINIPRQEIEVAIKFF